MDKKCDQVLRDVPDKQCTTVPEKQCVDEEQTVYETSYTHSCEPAPSQVRMARQFSVLSASFLAMVRFEPGAAGWKAQTSPLGYSHLPLSVDTTYNISPLES